MTELWTFAQEIKVCLKRIFILYCHEKQYLSRGEVAILRKELAKIEKAENQLKHVRSIVEKTLAHNEAMPSSNLTF